MRILVTGGLGYIGSHTARLLTRLGHEVAILDDLSTGHAEAVEGLPVFECDLLTDRLEPILGESGCEAVIHFAGKALVPESVRDPALYWKVNTIGGLRLLEAMRTVGVRRLVFSSTCAVYGVPDVVPIREDAPTRPITPYGASKRAFEQALEGYAAAYALGAIALRYFNAAGAEADGRNGEDHAEETHLIPRLLVAARDGLAFTIHGTDYDTKDGTCIRDYIHVTDLAEAHLAAVEAAEPGRFEAINLGTGRGRSVREVVAAAERVSGHRVHVVEGARRPGDPPALVADPGLAASRLGFRAKRTLDDILASAWAWHARHRHGYAAAATRSPRFGEIAVQLGILTPEQLEEGLAAQRARLERGERHQLLGLLLLERGVIDNADLIRILRVYSDLAAQGSEGSRPRAGHVA